MCAPLRRIQGSALVQNLSQDLPAGKYRPSGGSRLATRDTATGPLTRKICYRSWTLAPAAASKSSRPEQAERGKFASFGHRRSVVKVKRPVGLGACVALMEHDRLGVMGATTMEECSISIPTSPSSTPTSEVIEILEVEKLAASRRKVGEAKRRSRPSSCGQTSRTSCKSR